jgi:2-keto-4-pentenoate hydratase/2-oxohepta-3-ene-1,7-dioic acid hydratase in catechol pathway
MRLITFRSKFAETKSAPRVGCLLTDNLILDFCEALSAHEKNLEVPADPISWFDLDGPWLSALRTLQDRIWQDFERPGGTSKALVHRDQVQLLAPVLRPGKLICVGLNYRDHAAESNMPIPESPVIFSKFTTAVVGSDQPVLLPTTSNKVDYEAELAVVIGRRAKHVQREQALDYVLGYTCFNDISARDFQFADGQWQRGKSCDTFAPMGPYIATSDEIRDPHNLSIKLRLNGQTMQDSNTDQLIFGVPELIAFLSETITLEPGDVIATGTPPGVGFARNPPVFLKRGDRMEVEIEGLGALVNTVTHS